MTKNLKKDEYEEPMPEGAPKQDEKPAKDPESRLDALEEEVKSISNSVGKILKAVQKDDDMDEDDAEEDKKKDIGTEDVNPSPEGGDAKLPDAPAGETDETAGPEGDKAKDPVSKSEINKMIEAAAEKKVSEVLKSMGITKSTTPRAQHEQDIKKAADQKKGEYALDLLKRAKAGEINMADMNKETKEFVSKSYEENIARVLNAEVQR